MRKTIVVALAAITLVATGTAYAQIPERGARQAEMTRDAAQQRADAVFERLDANKDGALDAADRETNVRARFDAVDTDKDGAISYEEFTALRENRKERLGDRRAKRDERLAARGERGQFGQRGRMGRGAGRLLGDVARADIDQDRKITREEFDSAVMARFDAADADNDGTITREERRAAGREMLRARRGQSG